MTQNNSHLFNKRNPKLRFIHYKYVLYFIETKSFASKINVLKLHLCRATAMVRNIKMPFCNAKFYWWGNFHTRNSWGLKKIIKPISGFEYGIAIYHPCRLDFLESTFTLKNMSCQWHLNNLCQQNGIKTLFFI